MTADPLYRTDSGMGVRYLLTFVSVKTTHQMALWTVVSAALTTFAASQVLGETGGTGVFALVFGTLV